MRSMFRSLSCAVVTTLLLTGCPGDSGKSGGVSHRSIVELEQRARGFWAARMAGDLIATFEYEDAKLSGSTSLQQYVTSRGALVYKRAEVKGAECTGGTEDCVVQVAVEYILPAMGTKPIASEIKDPWHLVDGQWVHRFKTGISVGRTKAPDAPAPPAKQP